MRPGELRLQDLGYSRPDTFIRLAEEHQAYYLSRLQSHLPLWTRQADGSFVPFDPFQTLQAIQGDLVEMEVWLQDGSRSSATRLVIEKVPEAVRELRIRNLRQQAQKKGRTPKDKTILWQGFNLHISNVPAPWLPASCFRLFYSLRWSVELLFKNWKSNFSLNQIPNVKRERVLCTLYAKLIFIFITHQLASLSRSLVWGRNRREVSLFRACKHFKTTASQWLFALWNHQPTEFVLNQRLRFLEKNCLKSKQNTRVYPLEIMDFLSCAIARTLNESSLEFISYVNRNYATH